MEILLFSDESQSGPKNMAVDEALLDWSRKLGKPILRFYRWNEPTLSLGYFQKYTERENHRPSLEITAVRRRSGGGAIVHDRELTYSLAAPPGHAFSTKQRLFLYQTVHRALIDVLRQTGIDAQLVSEASTKPKYDDKEFLCFKRFADGDIVSFKNQEPIKIVGSAQYRDKYGGVLQHGSLLLDRSVAAPELKGIRQLIDRADLSDFRDTDPWIENICRAFEKNLSWRFICRTDAMNSAQNDEFHETIAFHLEKRYAKSRWLLKK